MAPHDPPIDEIFSADLEGLIFDCDGTLIDTMPSHLLGWREALALHGLTMSDAEYYDHAGAGTKDIIAKLAESQGVAGLDIAIVAADKARLTEAHLHTAELGIIEGVFKVMLEAKRRGIKVGVASGGESKDVKLVLDRCGMMQYVDALVCRNEVLNGKPHPEAFLVCAERLGVDPTRCVAFEDGDLGMQAIQAAGMKAYDVRYWTDYPLPDYLRQVLFG